jgi:hypothetical protein
MWSHYADKHQGVVLEMEVDSSALIAVTYVKERIPFDLTKISLVDGFTSDDAEVISSTKSHHWAYEREQRVPVELRRCVVAGGLYFEPLSPRLRVVGLIAGHLCNLDVTASCRTFRVIRL